MLDFFLWVLGFGFFTFNRGSVIRAFMNKHVATGCDSFQYFYIRKLFFLKEKLCN